MNKNKINDLSVKQIGEFCAPVFTYLTLLALLFGGVTVAGAGCLFLLLSGEEFFGFPLLAGSLLGAMGVLGLALRLEKSFPKDAVKKNTNG